MEVRDDQSMREKLVEKSCKNRQSILEIENTKFLVSGGL
jgi:hypothetical protein